VWLSVRTTRPIAAGRRASRSTMALRSGRDGIDSSTDIDLISASIPASLTPAREARRADRVERPPARAGKIGPTGGPATKHRGVAARRELQRPAPRIERIHAVARLSSLAPDDQLPLAISPTARRRSPGTDSAGRRRASHPGPDTSDPANSPAPRTRPGGTHMTRVTGYLRRLEGVAARGGGARPGRGARLRRWLRPSRKFDPPLALRASCAAASQLCERSPVNHSAPVGVAAPAATTADWRAADLRKPYSGTDRAVWISDCVSVGSVGAAG
jgi:hypothetical protein